MSSTNSLALLATKYLSAAGLTILIYDHIVLFDQEVRYIWKAKHSWCKWLFLFNHYTTPLFLIINSFALGPWPGHVSTKFCENWIAAVAILPIFSLGVVNVFVAQRIYALWGSNKMVLKVLCFVMGAAYTSSIVVAAIGVKQVLPFVIYDSALEMCVPQKVSTLFAVGYGIPLILELVNFSLLCWNALDRPRHLHTLIVKQLYQDGVVYFLAVTALRTINVIMFAGKVPHQFKLLFSFFIWAMVPTIVHRMILTLNDNVGDPHDEPNDLDINNKRRWSHPFGLQPVPRTSSSLEITEETYSFTDSII